MNTRILSGLAAATLFAAGCSTMSGDGKVAAGDTRAAGGDTKMAATNEPGMKCMANQTVCHITVRVKDCKVTVTPEEKRVAQRPGGVTMLWTIRESPGVVFASTGIGWKREIDTEARHVFRTDHKSLASATVSMHNNTAVGKYPYNVFVVDNGKLCPAYDPSVINEM